jgi:hypothetical protein
MSKVSISTMIVVLVAIPISSFNKVLRADCPDYLQALNPFRGTPVDIHCPASCDTCGHEVCVDRQKVEDYVKGEKKLYKSTVRKQYVAIPEVRYRWEMKCVTREVPCECCMPVCKPEEVDHPYQAEHWERDELPCGSERYCKTCETKTEKLPEVTTCETKPGKTTIKVHYWTCVQVPYTVYRQVEQEVGIKQPYYEKVDVPICRHVCEHCGVFGCSCDKQCPGGPNVAIDGPTDAIDSSISATDGQNRSTDELVSTNNRNSTGEEQATIWVSDEPTMDLLPWPETLSR